MRIAFFDTKPYDRNWFDIYAKEYNYEIEYLEGKLSANTAILAQGCEVACVFVNDNVEAATIDALLANGVKLLALRSAGYNHVNLKAACGRLPVVRVPAYSPYSVAEHAAALLLSLNRKIHRAYVRTRDNNFSINGLMGFDLYGKTLGIIGTGKIGRLFARIMSGFGMEVLAYDPYPAEDSLLKYVSLDELFASAHVISLHCPLTNGTLHIINDKSIAAMRDDVIIINTSRGALIDSNALLDGLKSRKVGGAGLDVYEEEENYFFEDYSNEILEDDELARLLSLPNVLITSHQAFFTREATKEIARVTIENIRAFQMGQPLENEVKYSK